jgi:hypothetical protein
MTPMRPSWRQPLPVPLAWLLIACVPQIIATLAVATPGIWSQAAGMSAILTITAIVTLGRMARAWPDGVSRLHAGQTVWSGCCLIASLDAYVCARGLLGWERVFALIASIAVLVALLGLTVRVSRST